MTSTGHASAPSGAIVTTDIPARLDRLRWGRFHTLVVVALGITWILDGLEVTLAGAIAPALKESPRLHFSNAEVGLVSSAYLAGAVVGAHAPFESQAPTWHSGTPSEQAVPTGAARRPRRAVPSGGAAPRPSASP